MRSGVIGLLVAYLAGSIPWAYLAGRLLKGIDLRQHGSGNLGATNVYRVLGAPAAVAVLALDAAKGALPVLYLPTLLRLESPGAWPLAFGLAAIAGHVKPAFLGWRGGGKGIATAAGVFAVLVPVALLVAAGAFAIALAATRYMSLSSLTGAVTLPVAVAVWYGVATPMFWVSLGVSGFVFWTHRSNLDRLRRGVEPRFGQKSAV